MVASDAARDELARGEMVDWLWEQIEPTVFITKDEWLRGLDGWKIEPVEIAGRLAFVTLTKGPEFHFASFGTGTAASLGLIRSLFAPIFEEFGFVTTRTPREGADRQHRFNKLLGFKITGEDEYFIMYRMDKKCR